MFSERLTVCCPGSVCGTVYSVWGSGQPRTTEVADTPAPTRLTQPSTVNRRPSTVTRRRQSEVGATRSAGSQEQLVTGNRLLTLIWLPNVILDAGGSLGLVVVKYSYIQFSFHLVLFLVRFARSYAACATRDFVA